MEGAPEVGTAQPEVVLPCGQAWHGAKAALFPLDVGKWLTLGFVAWLAMPAFGNFSFTWNSGRKHYHAAGWNEPLSGRHVLEQSLGFLSAHFLLFVFGAIFGLAVYLLFAFLRSRGVFMYLDCVAGRKAAVVEPWRNSRKHWLSYFCWQLALDFGFGLTVLALGCAACAALGWAPWCFHHQGGPELGAAAVVALVLLAAAFLAGLFAYILVKWALHNLVATLMYLRGIPGRRAWGELLRLFLKNPGTLLLYLLMNVALHMLYVVLLLPACCCTCCLGALPVISQTVMQPMLYWIRAYPFFFLAQFGPEYRLPAGLLPGPAAAATSAAQPPPAGMNAQSGAPVPPEPPRIASCPQCGQPHLVLRGGSGAYVCVKCGARFEEC